jgi:hypothetical protein
MKVVVFDLDETLGYFFELGKFWELLQHYFKENMLDAKEFCEILELFPEFIRPNMYSILNFLKYKKETKECCAVMIYSNNQGPRYWIDLIIEYFHSKIHYPLFDQIIAAFKINGKRIEIGRTTHDKTIDDFIRCTKLPRNTEICFVDDVEHDEMIADNVYYIKLNPYIYNLSFQVIINRFLSSEIGKKRCEGSVEKFRKYSEQYLKGFKYTYTPKSEEEYEIDKIVSKKTMLLLQDFFKSDERRGVKKTMKTRNLEKSVKKNKTLKKAGV